MRHVDSAILNATEWLCRKFQLLTGRTNVWLAVQLTNLSIVVYFVWAGVYVWNSDLVSRMAVGLFCGALLYVLTQTVLKVPIEAYENNAYHRVAKGLRNPRTGPRRPPPHVVSDAFDRAPLSNRVRLHHCSRPSRPPDVLPHRLDDGRLIRAGVRSASAMRRKAAGVAPRLSAPASGRVGIDTPLKRPGNRSVRGTRAPWNGSARHRRPSGGPRRGVKRKG